MLKISTGKIDRAGDIRIYTRSRARAARRTASEAGLRREVADPGIPSDSPSPFDKTSDEVAESAPRLSAAKRLGLDITRPWPEDFESLRRLFATQAPLESPLGDGYTYVLAPVPGPNGPEDCIVGLKAEDGRITGARYALPGRPAPEPPAGMEAYAWRDEGYWVWDNPPLGTGN